MPNKHYQVSFEVQPENTSLLVAEAFGIGPGWINRVVDVTLPQTLPQITLITGESGCGKSTLLKEIGKPTPFVAPRQPLHAWADSDEDALRLLNSVGLNDASLFVLRYHQLSDSQQARARMYLGLCRKLKTMIVDEFLATLDRGTAKALAYGFQKMLRRENISLVAVTAQDDLVDYLKPDLVIRGTAFPSDWTTESPKFGDSNPFDSLVIVEQETALSNRGTPGARCENILWDGTICGRNLCKPPLCMCGQNRKPRMSAGKDAYKNSRLGEIHYKGKYAGGVQEYISARMGERIIGWLVGAQQRTGVFRISRVVVHPTYRGCGIGQKLIRRYLKIRPDCDTVAAMARFNPVFERAGMKRVADIETEPPAFLNSLPLSRLDWASAEACQKLMRTPKWLEVVASHADALGRDTHPGGKTPVAGMAAHFRQHPDAAGQALWRVRYRRMAKYVGPAHPLFRAVV
jgi:ABC-type lipoprotein export system ATPase subunit/GNAT superfamily N-acetyltransferase